MKKLLIATASYAVLFGAQAAKAEHHEQCFDKGTLTYFDCEPKAVSTGVVTEVNVDLGVSFVATDTKDAGGDSLGENTPRLSGEARANLALGGGFALQIDLGGEVNLEDTSASNSGTFEYGGAGLVGAHVNWRDELLLIGAFAGFGLIDVTPAGDSNAGPGVKGSTGFDKEETAVLVGGEAQIFLGDYTLYGQAGYFESSERDSETLTEVIFGRASGRYYFGDDTALTGTLLYGEGGNTAEDDEDITVLGWGLEVRSRSLVDGFDVFARYSGTHTELFDDGDFEESGTEHVGTIGISFQFGEDGSLSLKDSQRRGAAVDIPLDTLRGAGYTSDVVDD